MSKIRICLAGATGWAGSELARGISAATDIELVSAVSRSHAGRNLEQTIGCKGLTTPIFATMEEALQTRPNVLVEYTKPDVAKHHGPAGANAQKVTVFSSEQDSMTCLKFLIIYSTKP